MCGIAGIIGKYNQLDIDNFIKSMAHRGPDGSNFYKNDKFCFIHSLLKIMDLSENSVQPMADERNGNIIIFNGSIYNYKELKVQYFSNTKFKSNTDTEILLYLYEKFGMDFLKYVKGMFSIALYDKKYDYIYIIRDRFGIKPLYYFSNSNYLIFASEIKILLSHRIVKNSLNLNFNEILNFIAHRLLCGSQKTLLKNIKVLEPSKYIKFNLNNNNLNFHTYNYELEKLTLNKKYNQEIFDEQFNKSVKYHTITEHKRIACLLSGGLDSSLLATVLKRQCNNKEIHIFSSLLNTPNEENKNIKILVKEYNFVHHYLEENSVSFFEDHLKTVKDMDLPTPDAATTLHNLLCKKISKNGFKVVFTGNGGDEFFFGYPLHIYGYLSNLIKMDINKFYLNYKNISKYSYRESLFLRSFKELLNLKLLNIIKNIQIKLRTKHLDLDEKYFENKYYKNLSGNLFKNIILNYRDHWGMQSFLDYEDKNSMAYGIESRVPFMDYDLVDLASRISPTQHFEIGSKSLLRKHKIMPINVKNSTNKYGFAANQNGYIEKNKDKIKEKIFYEFKNIPLINNDKLIKLLENNHDDYNVFFRTYSYGVWFNNIFN